MKMNPLAILCVGMLLGAGLSFAKPPKPAPPPEPITKEAPKTCEDQCVLMEKACTDPCKKMKKGSPQAKAACTANCDQISAACSGSCREKGRMDAQYIMKHIKAPKAPPGTRIQEEDHHE
ncbi:hypothetical protein P2318_06180 [Myxococcaceae bacterium GXIMD 01537]